MIQTKQALASAFLLLWGACGMRTDLLVSADDTDEGGGVAGAGGAAFGGSAGHGSGGHTSASGSGGTASGGSGGTAAGASGGQTKGGGGTTTGGSGGRPSGGSGAGGQGGSGGTPGTGGTTVNRDAGPDLLVRPDAIVGRPTIDPNSGYALVPTGSVEMSGYVSSYIGGSGSSISLTCTESSFCASGTVGASSTYSSWAGAGFNVNQAKSGSSGSTGSLPLVGTTISVSYVNPGGSRLELQLWDGSNYWCCYLPAASTPTVTTLPLASLNTKCWDGTGTAFVSGTSITTVQLVVPGSATTPTPFDYCFLGLAVD